MGIGVGPTRSGGSAGASVALHGREGSTADTLVDLNGDGLPDRVHTSEGRTQVFFNTARPTDPPGQARRFSTVAPPGDPLSGGTLSNQAAIPLGGDVGASVSLGLAGYIGGLSANVTGTGQLSIARSMLVDADGDGLVDIVSPGSVQFNQPRGSAACPASQFCFAGAKSLSGLDSLGGAIRGDSPLIAVDDGRAHARHPSDALLEWTAPYDGTVSVDGMLAWAGQVSTSGTHDGVRLRIFRDSQQLEQLALRDGLVHIVCVAHWKSTFVVSGATQQNPCPRSRS